MTAPLEVTARARRLLAGFIGTAFWLGLGAFVGWASAHFWQSWQLATARHGVLLAGFVLCAMVGAVWLAASVRLAREISWRLAEERDGAGTRPRSSLSLLLAPLAAPIVGMIVALSSPGAPVPSAAQVAVATAAPGGAGGAARTPDSTTGASRPRSRSYLVRAGDTLLTIAEREYGSADDWTLIAAANLGRPEPGGARFVDPTVLHAGWRLELPAPGGAGVHGPAPSARHEPAGANGTGTAATEAAAAARDHLLLGSLAGLGTLGTLVFAAGQRRRRRLQAMRAPAGSRPRRSRADDAAVEAIVRPLSDSLLPVLVGAASRLLTVAITGWPGTAPRVGAVRLEAAGVELWLEQAAPEAPEPFETRHGGWRWWLPVGVALAESERVAGALAYLPVLVPFGEDDSSSYLLAAVGGDRIGLVGEKADIEQMLAACALQLDNAEWAEVELFRLGPCSFPAHELAEELTAEGLESVSPPGGAGGAGWRLSSGELQPVVLVEDCSSARLATALEGPAVVIGALEGAPRSVRLSPTGLRLEPLGLEIPGRLPTRDEALTLLRLRHASVTEPVPPAEPAGRVDEPRNGTAPAASEVAGAESVEATSSRRAVPELPVPGAVEVRLLRAVPDLVGDLRQPATPAAVQLVAYLALHGGSAATHKMRDALGVYRRDQSTREKTIYNAASATRRVLGREHFPLVVGNEPYRLGPAVSCDWLRFERSREIAARCRRLGELEGELEALQFALELVGDGMPTSDKALAARFVWLDAELVLEDITYSVLEVAHRLATLGFGLGDLDLVAFAVGRGRQVAPENDQLRELAMLLADARGDRSAALAELEAHVEAVDGLRLGADLSERIELLASELALRPQTGGAGAQGATWRS